MLLSSTSLQVGLAVAATAFATAGPVSAVWIRSLVGAVLLGLYIRPDPRSFTREQLASIGVYGLALGTMTLFAYLAIADAPLGVVAAIVMLGPLGVASWGKRSPADLLIVAVAAAGALVLSLASGVDGDVGVAGLAFSFAAAAAFAAYIVSGKRVSQHGQGLQGLAAALLIAAVIQTPLGLVFARPGLTEPAILATLALAGVLATLIPFSLEAIALRTLPMASFGLLLAFEPAVAAIAGVAIRADTLSSMQVFGIALVIVAAAGSLGPRGWLRWIGAYNRRIMADERARALAKVPLFAGLTAKDLGAVSKVADERVADSGEVLTREGEEGDEFFIIRDGAVAITTGERHLAVLGPGDYLGEIALMFSGPRTATAVAEERTDLFVIRKDEFLALLKQHPRIEEQILTSVSDRMRYR